MCMTQIIAACHETLDELYNRESTLKETGRFSQVASCLSDYRPNDLLEYLMVGQLDADSPRIFFPNTKSSVCISKLS